MGPFTFRSRSLQCCLLPFLWAFPLGVQAIPDKPSLWPVRSRAYSKIPSDTLQAIAEYKKYTPAFLSILRQKAEEEVRRWANLAPVLARQSEFDATIAEEPHIGFGTPRGARWNRLTYRLANRVMIRKNILDYGGDLAREWGMPLDHQTLSSFFLTQLPIEVATEPQLFPRPAEWPSHVRMTGFRERDKAQHWTADPALEDFLELL